MRSLGSDRPFHYKLGSFIPLLTLLLLGGVLLGSATVRAQGEAPGERLEITAIDKSAFPELGINLIVTDAQSQPLQKLDTLRLRENSVPIADFQIRQVTTGIDLYFVIDANERITEVEDDGGMTRLQKVRDTILYYSGRFMDLAGRDRVSVIVPDGENGRVLVEEVSQPTVLIDAVRAYDPGNVAPAPVVPMLEQTLERAAVAKAGNRFQAVVLFTDSLHLNSYLFPPLIERARSLQVPIFVLLLAPPGNESAVERVMPLTVPTRGFHEHIPSPSDSEEIFQVLQANATQTQVRYSTNLSETGTYPIDVTLGDLEHEITFDLRVEQPEVMIELAETNIKRVGTQPNARLQDLQPAVQTVPVQIAWPDDMPRRLSHAALLADGVPQEAPFVGTDQQLQFDWDLSALTSGQYQLTVQVTDTLGLTTESEPVVVTIDAVRPAPLPTPIPTQTPTPLSVLRRAVPDVPLKLQDVERKVGLIALFLIAAVFITYRLRRTTEDDVEVPPITPDQQHEGVDLAKADSNVGAVLEIVQGNEKPISIRGANSTIGRDPQHAELVLQDRSISPLHARIGRRGATYWLYDEGSENGTYLNYERLGLSPKPLSNGDEIQLGRLRLRFWLVAPDTGQADIEEEE